MSTIPIGTSDGMLTRATPLVPPGSRARSITVSARNYADVRRISVSISPDTILMFEYSYQGIVSGKHNELTLEMPQRKDKRSSYWSGWAWKMMDTSTWYQVPFRISSSSAVKAYDVVQAVVEHLRFILNRELRIRPVVSDSVCTDVLELLKNRMETKKTYQGVRTVMSQLKTS